MVAARTTGSVLALTFASTLGVSCGDEPCPPTGPPPFEQCLVGSDEPGCELPLTIDPGPLSTDEFPLFECSGWDDGWVSPVCFARSVVGSGTNPVIFRHDGYHAGHYFVLALDPETERARLCTEYETDVYVGSCPVGGEEWQCANAGTVTIEENPPAGLQPLTELRATFADGGAIHAIW